MSLSSRDRAIAAVLVDDPWQWLPAAELATHLDGGG